MEPVDEPDDGAARKRAVANAGAALGLAANEPTQIWSVTRMKPGAAGYFLVVFGAPQAAVGLAAVDRVSGAVLAKARLPGRGPHHLISAEEAIRHAGLDAGTQAVLAWDPVPASRSPFYPLWQLQGPDQTVWVDGVSGTIWKSLDNPRGGGTGVGSRFV